MEENRKDFNELDKDFISSLYRNLMIHSAESFTVKKALGKSMEEDIKAYIAFRSISKGNIFKPKEDIYFFVATLFYNSESRVVNNEDKENEYVRFEKLLNRLYKDIDNKTEATKTTKRAITALISSDYDDKGAFKAKFIKLFYRAIKMRFPGERVDYLSLLKDLKFWNAEDNGVRRRWAEVIVG